jgi:GAF domain-containing protein
MSEKRSSKRPEKPVEAEDLRARGRAFVATFFKKGAELTEEILHENERLTTLAGKLESDVGSLRAQLKKDSAIREARKKIDELESERESLQSQFSQAEAATNRFARRHAEVEEELANMANLYIATVQLHSSIGLPAVMKNVRELLAQIVGARTHGVYVVDDKRRMLVPVASDGVELEKLPRVRLVETSEPPKGAAAVLERVFLTGVAHIEEGPAGGCGLDAPAACIPLRADDRAIGVIAIYDLLPQKERFVAVDLELLRMLTAHGGSALVGAMLYAEAGGKLPGLDVFRDLRELETTAGDRG